MVRVVPFDGLKLIRKCMSKSLVTKGGKKEAMANKL